MGVAQDRVDNIGLQNNNNGDSIVHRFKTEELTAWINQFRIKRTVICKKRKSDYRLRAMIASALHKAEQELKMKQQERYKKWQLIKSELFGQSDVIINSNCKDENYCDWNPTTSSEDFDSLNMFMSKLNEVKRPLER